MKNFSQTVKSLTIAFILVGGVSYIYAWTGPSTTPPNGNVAAPVNVGSVGQTKNSWFASTELVSSTSTASTFCIGSNCITSWPSQTSASSSSVSNSIVKFSQSGTWACPSGVTRAKVRVWGAGGAGGMPSTSNPTLYNNYVESLGGGGGGGGYAESIVAVIPGNTYSITVGKGGTQGNFSCDYGNTGGNGGISSFANLVIANGGFGGGQYVGGLGATSTGNLSITGSMGYGRYGGYSPMGGSDVGVGGWGGLCYSRYGGDYSNDYGKSSSLPGSNGLVVIEY